MLMAERMIAVQCVDNWIQPTEQHIGRWNEDGRGCTNRFVQNCRNYFRFFFGWYLLLRSKKKSRRRVGKLLLHCNSHSKIFDSTRFTNQFSVLIINWYQLNHHVIEKQPPTTALIILWVYIQQCKRTIISDALHLPAHQFWFEPLDFAKKKNRGI